MGLTRNNLVKCMDPSKNTLYISLTGLVTFLDALTDLMSQYCFAIPSPQ